MCEVSTKLVQYLLRSGAYKKMLQTDGRTVRQAYYPPTKTLPPPKKKKKKNVRWYKYRYVISMGECDTILSAYTKYRHLG